MQGCVAVAVGHVDHVPQHGGGEDGESLQVVLHHGRKRQFLAGHAEPLVLHRVETSSLCIGGGRGTGRFWLETLAYFTRVMGDKADESLSLI